MKETLYFSHDYNPSNDPKMSALIAEYGAFGYGLFWCITEMLHQEDIHKLPLKQYVYIAIAKQMQANAKQYQTSTEQIENFVKHCIYVCELFVCDSDFFYSPRVLRNFEKRSQISQKRSKAGKLGAIAKQTQASAKQNLAKPSKENKRKENKKDNTIECETLYKLYPSRDINNEGRSTGKSSKDKDKIEKLLDKNTFEELKKIFESYLSDAARTKSYLKNFSTFLNQLPEVPEEAVVPAATKPTKFEFPEPVRVREKVMQRFPGWRDYDYWPSDFDLDTWHWMYMEIVVNEKKRSQKDIVADIKLRLEEHE